MLITYMGHSQFLLESASGLRVLTDPYDQSAHFPIKEAAADVVTISHGHGDHSYLKKVLGSPMAVRTAGVHTLPEGCTAEAFPSYHDEEQGGKRGGNLLFKIHMDGLVIAHLGDLGHPLHQEQLDFLGGTHILLVPVGGFYTIDAGQAKTLVELVNPRITIPMHYRTSEGGLPNIATVEDFLSLMAPRTPSRQPLLRVTKEDLSQQPGLVVLKVQLEA